MNCEFLTLLLLVIGKNCSQLAIEYLDPNGDVSLAILQDGKEFFNSLSYRNAMSVSVTYGLVDAAKFMLKREITRIKEHDLSWRKTLSLKWHFENAVSRGHLDIVIFLYDNGVSDIKNVVNDCLLTAIDNNRINVIDFMLLKGATNYTDALQTAASNSTTEVILHLTEKIPFGKDKLLLLLSKYNTIPVLENLLSKNDYSLKILSSARRIALQNDNRNVSDYLLNRVK